MSTQTEFLGVPIGIARHQASTKAHMSNCRSHSRFYGRRPSAFWRTCPQIQGASPPVHSLQLWRIFLWHSSVSVPPQASMQGSCNHAIGLPIRCRHWCTRSSARPVDQMAELCPVPTRFALTMATGATDVRGAPIDPIGPAYGASRWNQGFGDDVGLVIVRDAVTVNQPWRCGEGRDPVLPRSAPLLIPG